MIKPSSISFSNENAFRDLKASVITRLAVSEIIGSVFSDGITPFISLAEFKASIITVLGGFENVGKLLCTPGVP